MALEWIGVLHRNKKCDIIINGYVIEKNLIALEFINTFIVSIFMS